jgi:hypothetical protein
VLKILKLQFCVSRFVTNYTEYLNAVSERSQLDLANSHDKDVLVYMQCTEWSDLQTQDGRRLALCHILALLRRHDTEDVRRQTAASESGDGSFNDDDSMDTGE